jgi:hypothetical protein
MVFGCSRSHGRCINIMRFILLDGEVSQDDLASLIPSTVQLTRVLNLAIQLKYMHATIVVLLVPVLKCCFTRRAGKYVVN